jgi:hypothetical protein
VRHSPTPQHSRNAHPAALAAHATSQIDQAGVKVDCERNCQHSNLTTSKPPGGDLDRRK